MNRFLSLTVLTLMALAPLTAFAQGEKPILLRKAEPNPQSVKCDNVETVSANGNVSYLVGKATLVLPAKDVVYAYRPRKDCAELVSADKAADAGNWAKVYSDLQAANTKYAKLGWDANIIYMQGLALQNQKRNKDALNVLERIRSITTDKFTAWKRGDIDAALSLLVLIAAEENDAEKVKSVSEYIFTSGSKAHAAALTAAGEVAYTAGKKREAAFNFMKAGLLYNDPIVCPQALCRAANVLKELGDARGKRFADKLKADYAGNEWISKLK